MKKLDDAKRRFGVPGERVFSQEEICKHFKVPVGLLRNVAPPIRLDGTSQIPNELGNQVRLQVLDTIIARQKQEIEALNKLLNDRDETIDCMVHSPQEIMGWLTCAALVVTVFLAHGLGYL